MSLWSSLRNRLLGSAPEPTQVDRLELVPGLSVSVTRHSIGTERGPISCTSYVTQGLAEHGQKEMVFTLREREGMNEAAFRQRLFMVFAQFHQLAAQGRTVDVGGCTQFGDPRPFPGWQVLYTSACPLSGVPVPQNALAPILIRDKELEVVQQCGPARVMSALGKASLHYPCPPWSDLQRPELPAAAMLENSLLTKFGGAAMWSTRVMQVEGDLLLRAAPGSHEHFRELLGQLPDELQPFALFTGIDSTADACLTWEPGQREASAITPPGSKGERVSGCYLLIAPGQEQEEVRLIEDGFVWCLAESSAKALRRALCEEQALALLIGGKRLRVEWAAP